MSRRRRKDKLVEFIDTVCNLPINELKASVSQEYSRMKEHVRELKYYGINDTFLDELRYFQELKMLSYFLDHESVPETCSPYTSRKFKWLAAKLVKRSEMSPEVLEYFEY